MKQVFFLAGDYWHPADMLATLAEQLFPADRWTLHFTENPDDLFTCTPDLIVTFKDPVLDSRNPTPIWCGEEWSARLIQLVEGGAGLIVGHAALTDIPAAHPLAQRFVRSTFSHHPTQCPVTVQAVREHPVMQALPAFTFPEPDEQYFMLPIPDVKMDVLAVTESRHGEQPGVWAGEVGQGRYCCITPGHTLNNLTCPGFLCLMQNAANWCARR